MKQLNLLVLSLAALAFGRPRGLCTANTQADDLKAMQEQLDAQKKELETLRAAQPVPLEPLPEIPSATALLIKGAGVDPEAVNWRIRAGLSPEHAVEVAANEKAESAAAKKKGK